MSDSLWPHELQHARLPCPLSPGVCSDSCPLNYCKEYGNINSGNFQSFTSKGNLIQVNVQARIFLMVLKLWPKVRNWYDISTPIHTAHHSYNYGLVKLQPLCIREVSVLVPFQVLMVNGVEAEWRKGVRDELRSMQEPRWWKVGLSKHVMGDCWGISMEKGHLMTWFQQDCPVCWVINRL